MLVFMAAKVKAYFPIIAVILIAAALGIWAIAEVAPDRTRGYIPINNNVLNTHVYTGSYGVDQASMADGMGLPNNLDIDELNRRLIADGLEPILLPEPKPVTQKPEAKTEPPLEAEPQTESESPAEAQPVPPEEISLPEKPETEVNIPSADNEAPDSEKNLELAEIYTKQPLIVAASYADCPKPAYPPAAQSKGIEGKVILRVKVGADGKPVEVKLVSSSGNRMLDRAAIDTVTNSWRFKAATRDGVGFESWVEVPIAFELGE